MLIQYPFFIIILLFLSFHERLINAFVPVQRPFLPSEILYLQLQSKDLFQFRENELLFKVLIFIL